MIGHTSKGDWKSLSIGSSTATVYKDSDSDTVTLTVEVLHKKATWSVAKSAVATEDVGGCHSLSYYRVFKSYPSLSRCSWHFILQGYQHRFEWPDRELQ